MIRYLIKEDVYYSLKDVTSWLVEQEILTPGQSQSFSFNCKAHMVTKLASAYQMECVYQHLEPVILPINDYFFHWIVWAKLLILMPDECRRNKKVETLSRLLDNPETVYLRSHLKYGINLVQLNDQMSLVRIG